LPAQTGYDEEISQGRPMLQNLGVINANATGSLHSSKLQQGWDVAAVGHHTAEVSQDMLIPLKPIRAA
jgi:hypothetical protein